MLDLTLYVQKSFSQKMGERSGQGWDHSICGFVLWLRPQELHWKSYRNECNEPISEVSQKIDIIQIRKHALIQTIVGSYGNQVFEWEGSWADHEFGGHAERQNPTCSKVSKLHWCPFLTTLLAGSSEETYKNSIFNLGLQFRDIFTNKKIQLLTLKSCSFPSAFWSCTYKHRDKRAHHFY